MADTKKYEMTQQGYDKLVAERDNLVQNVRLEVIAELQEARAQGDLSENADYDAARDHQAQVEARIASLEDLIKHAIIIQESVESDVVELGSTVVLYDFDDEQELRFSIVGSVEANPLQGKISNITPLAKVIIGHRVGDVVEVEHVERPYKVRIDAIQAQKDELN